MNEFAIRVLTAPLGRTHIFSVGQAGFIVKSAAGQLLGIDLYLSDYVERDEGHVGYKRLLPKILAPNELEFDCLIATHPHPDHFDPDSMPLLLSGRKTCLFASRNCEEIASRLRLEREKITYAGAGDVRNCGDFELEFIDCDHGAAAPDAFGVVVRVDKKTVCEVGDTCLHLDWQEMYRSKGPFDLMIAPINGAFGNLDERACAELAAAVRPALTVPCHYGMFASHGGNPGVFHRIMSEEHPDLKYDLLSYGEMLTLPEK